MRTHARTFVSLFVLASATTLATACLDRPVSREEPTTKSNVRARYSKCLSCTSLNRGEMSRSVDRMWPAQTLASTNARSASWRPHTDANAH